jgi:hypothetical protein
VGDAGTILTSPDGTTWTPQTSGTTADLYAAAGNSSIIVVAGVGIFTSPTGTVWTSRTSVGGNVLHGAVWSGAQFLIVGDSGPSGSLSTAQTSFDGMAWAARPTTFANAMFAAAWSGSEFMIVGQSGVTLHSADGIGWTGGFEESSLGPDLNGVGWHNNRFIAVGTGGRILTTL